MKDLEHQEKEKKAAEVNNNIIIGIQITRRRKED